MSNKIEIERRVERRTYLKHACSFTVYTGEGLVPFDTIELTNISSDGISFAISREFAVFEPGEQIHARLYLNGFKSNTLTYYIPIEARITNANEYISSSGEQVRYGCTIEHDGEEFKAALQSFIEFIEASSKFIREDKGDYFIPNTIA